MQVLGRVCCDSRPGRSLKLIGSPVRKLTGLKRHRFPNLGGAVHTSPTQLIKRSLLIASPFPLHPTPPPQPFNSFAISVPVPALPFSGYLPAPTRVVVPVNCRSDSNYPHTSTNAHIPTYPIIHRTGPNSLRKKIIINYRCVVIVCLFYTVK